MTLRRHGSGSVEQLVPAYPLRFLEITGIGSKALRDVEAAFFEGQRSAPMKTRKAIERMQK